MHIDELNNRFTYHKPKEDQASRYEQIRNVMKDTAFHILTACPDSREKSLAITKLEEAVFWANASIARHE